MSPELQAGPAVGAAAAAAAAVAKSTATDAMAFDDGGDAAATTVGDGVYMVLTV